MRLFLLIASFALISLPLPLAAQAPFAAVGGDVLDPAAFTQWLDGAESPIAASEAKEGPKSLVWSNGHRPDWRGVRFGEGRSFGPRHLRIGLTQAVPVGSVLVRGGGSLSVLKSDAAYPGNVADDSQWLAAERLLDGQVSQAQAGTEDYAIWTLPAGTQTRALRFTHQPAPGDRESSGWLGGVYVLANRFGNIAPQAICQTNQRDDVSAKLIDRTNNRQWLTWNNGEEGAALPVSPEHPEYITLTWPRAVELSGIALVWTGFADVEVQAFVGKDNENTREAGDASWKTVGQKSDMDSLYPMALGPHWIGFDQTVNTRALRLRVARGAKSTHPHLSSKVKEGRRIWLGEVLAIAPLPDDAALKSLILPTATEEPPPIPVRFHLPEAGLVTLVIEDQNGQRIRNLISETPFPAGDNIAWWDGSDDLLRDPQAAEHGLYHIPTRPVAPGTYKVRGLYRKPVKLHYEFSIYNAGKPAWVTADGTGCWLTTHTPPSSMAFVPGNRTADGQPLVMMGAYVAEGGHGLQWLHEDGTKIGGQYWVGGTWTGAQTLAPARGPQAPAEHLAYVGSIWEGELRLTAKSKSLQDQPILKVQLGEEHDRRKKDGPPAPETLEGFEDGNKIFVLGGIAAFNDTLVCAMTRQNELIVVDISKATIRDRKPLENPRGLTYDDQGRLLVLSGKKLLRFADLNNDPETIVDAQLEDPRQVVIDEAGQFFISDRGSSHQVKVFAKDGHFVRAIGKPGVPGEGPYDPLHMNNPNGLAIDSQGRLWVAESDNFPRRVSVWQPDGKLVRAFYGPTEYGGGGTLDSRDRNTFFYKGLEFRLDWEKGIDQLVRVYNRPDDLLHAHYGHYSPDTPLYPKAAPDERYFTSCYTHTPTGGDHVAFIWKDTPKEARLVAAVGNAHSWDILRDEAFRSHWPEGTRPDEDNPKPERLASFAWTDTDGDGRPQPNEVTFVHTRSQGVTVMNDLSMVVARFGDRCVRFDASLDEDNRPHYDLSKAVDLGPAGGLPPSSGGNQALNIPKSWTVTTNAAQPFSPYGLGGTLDGVPRWSYPSAWPGLHASHEAAVPDRPGMVVGHTRLLGGWIDGPAGPMFCINANMGNMYVFTADGLFVATLFHDIRLRPNWAAPVAIRNMDVTDVSLHDENFWPSITQTPDSQVYLVDGGRTSLVRVDGLETLRRLPESSVTVTTEDLAKAQDWFAQAEARRQQERGSGVLTVPLRAEGPKVDGDTSDWPAETDWAYIDRRGTKANFNSNSRPYEVSAAVTLTDSHLIAAWRTTEKKLLDNSGETPTALFKHGGCLDIMLATDPSAPDDRREPVPGDQRLLITQVEGRTRALLYRARVPGSESPHSFSSPWRSIRIDEVRDVSDAVALASNGEGHFEISVPLDVLSWKPSAGQTYRADLGVLRGANGQTTQRVYWTNKATAITADVPSEAELTPRLWGKWRITP